MILKKIAILIVSVLASAGCMKDDPVPDLMFGELAINVIVDGLPIAKTRAAETETALKTVGFYLAGYHTDGRMEFAVEQAYPNVFNYSAEDAQDPVPLVKLLDDKFTLKTIKWKLDDATYLKFFGWSQSKTLPTAGVTATTGIVAYTKEPTDKGYPWIDIRNADASVAQIDVIGSRSRDYQNKAVISAVDLEFRHVMSKLTFKAKSSSLANITFTAVNIKYAANKVYKKARYTFSSDEMVFGTYASFAEYHAGIAALNTTYPTIANGAEVVLGSHLLIPQALAGGNVSLEIKYKLSPNSQALPGVEQTKTLPLSAFTFAQGENYVYTIDVQATDILVLADPTIEPWNLSGTSLPVIPGPKGDVLLLLDGYNRPYQHSDGKWYWLDRSGYNRHVEIEGYADGMYNATAHTYALNATRNLKIPAFPSVTALTTDIITQLADRFNISLLSFVQVAAARNFQVTLGYMSDNVIYFDSNSNFTIGGGRLIYPSTVSEFTTKVLWSFQKQDRGAQNIYKNAKLVAATATSGSVLLGTMSINNIGNKEYVGTISYVKVTSKLVTPTEINTTFATCCDRFGLPLGPSAPAKTDYVVINGLAWTKGNLVAASNNTCRVGAASDYGLYFQFGSLVGWTGGADGSGVGSGSPVFDKRVWPTEMGVTKPSFNYQFNIAPGINTLSNYFFNYSISPWETLNALSDIGTFDVSMSGDAGLGNLRNGRYAKLGIGDPCTYYFGNPWRLPIQQELQALAAAGFSAKTQLNGVDGRWFGPNAGNVMTSIFLPFAGYRDNTANGSLLQAGMQGRYGTCSVRSYSQFFYMYIDPNKVNIPDGAGRNGPIPIRCVRDL